MNMNSYETHQKFNLQTVSGLSNYRATLDQQLHYLVNSPTTDNVVWLNKLAHFLNNWFIVEEHLLTPDSIKLKDLFINHKIEVPKNAVRNT